MLTAAVRPMNRASSLAQLLRRFNSTLVATELGEVAGSQCAKAAEEGHKVTEVRRVLRADNDAFKGLLPESVTWLVLQSQKHFDFKRFLAGAAAFGKTGGDGSGGDASHLKQLHDGILSHDLNQVQQCLEQGVNVNETLDENLALVLAVKEQQKDIVKVLLEAKADPNLCQTLTGNRDMVATIYPLYWCARIHDENQEIAKLLLAANAQVDLVDEKERTFLHFAGDYNNVAFTKLLLNHGADVFKRDYFYELTPLLSACVGGKTEIVKVHLSSGKYNIQEEKAHNLCYYCLRTVMVYGYVDIMELFFKHGLQPDDTTFEKQTLLLYLCDALKVPNNIIKVLKSLHEAGANFHAVDPLTGNGCFHFLAFNPLNAKYCIPAAAYLLWKDVDIYTKNLAGTTPLGCACETGNAKFISGMLDFGIDLQKEDPSDTGKYIISTLETLDGRLWYCPQWRIRVTALLLVAAGSPLPSVEQLTLIEEAIVKSKDTEEHPPSDRDIAAALELITWLKKKTKNPFKSSNLCQQRSQDKCQYCNYRCVNDFPIPMDLKKYLRLKKLILSKGILIDEIEAMLEEEQIDDWEMMAAAEEEEHI